MSETTENKTENGNQTKCYELDDAIHNCQNPIDILKNILSKYLTPTFGSLKQVEYELEILKALRDIGYICKDNDEYHLVEKLKVTKSKARNLIYQASLRNLSNISIDDDLRKLFISPIIKREGGDNDMYLLEVPNPLTMDRLRNKIRQLGFISDGSFSGTIAKIPGDALAKLIYELVDKKNLSTFNTLLSGITTVKTSKTEEIIKTVIAGFTEPYIGGTASNALGNGLINAGKQVGDFITNLFSGKANQQLLQNSYDDGIKLI